jgi:Tol biopolymer transport system component
VRRTSASILALAALVAAAPASAAQFDTELVSLSGVNGPSGTADALQPTLSADGDRVAFFSLGSIDPGLGAAPGVLSVYVRDRSARTLELASRASGPNGAAADDQSTAPRISADGRFVAFASNATNLDPADADPVADVYLRDLEQDSTVLVSRATGAGGAKANGGSFNPSVSADGRFVAFASTATNLSGADGDTDSDIYVRDLRLGTTTLVSQAANGDKADGDSDGALISGDGRYVAFLTLATNLSADDTSADIDVYVRTCRPVRLRSSAARTGPPAPAPRPTRARWRSRWTGRRSRSSPRRASTLPTAAASTCTCATSTRPRRRS